LTINKNHNLAGQTLRRAIIDQLKENFGRKNHARRTIVPSGAKKDDNSVLQVREHMAESIFRLENDLW
jgi:hypothetical protein